MAVGGNRLVGHGAALNRAASLPLWLQDPRIAAAVAKAILSGERERAYYELAAWVVMPNHVHLLITPHTPVPQITHWLKGSTARRANQILARTGQPFWQDESYDRYARGPERDRIADYIEMNPVVAGLTDSPEKFRWSSAWTG